MQTAESLHGGAPTISHGPSGSSVLAGGIDYVEPRDDRLCSEVKANGEPCQAWAGVNGKCVGHRPR